VRTFVAIDLPSVRGPLGLPERGGPDQAPEHLTLRFLGELPEARVAEVGSALERVARAHAPVHVELAGLGAFPDPRRPRVLFAAIRIGATELAVLRADLDRALEAIGIPSEGRPFVPHLTVLRIRGSRDLERARGLLERDRGATLAAATVGEILLKSSELRPGGARHTLLGRYPFGGPTPSNGRRPDP
jgi:RNA 2',3'-cyclic 3'-phosphodiesterase